MFALLNLGIVHSLATGVISVNDAMKRFYHVENCIYTNKLP